MPGWTQILVLLIILLVLFGGRKLPDLAHSLGKSLGEFKKGRAEGEKELEEVVNGGKTPPAGETGGKAGA
jgi:sec-independent protein translocase protein TatA